MRELRQLQLPKLIATRNSPSATHDESNPSHWTRLTSASENSWTSWTASDSSAPPTPTFSAHSHSRYPSSNSSVGSTSSPLADLPDASSSTTKLAMPQLPEHPMEREDQTPAIEQQVYAMNSLPSFSHASLEDVMSTRNTVILRNSDTVDFGDDLFSDDREPTWRPVPKRQASADSPSSIISSRLGERFPSFSRRRNHKKKDSKLAEAGLHIMTSSLPPSTRSSSLTSSMYQSMEPTDYSPILMSRNTSAAGMESAPVSPIEINHTEVEEPIDREKLASTPLLPPMVTTLPQTEYESLHSPLQSPTVAESSGHFSMVSSPADTPQLGGIPSPPLSTKPSVASFHRGRVGTAPSSEVPPLIFAGPNDEWSLKLGHANFTIFPEPYLPDSFTTDTYHRLVADWEEARVNYFKHQHRTLEHYGANSKTYKLTEQKWAKIDAQWRRNKDLTAIEASKTSDEALRPAPVEPATLLPMPVVHDMKNDGKFPILGDEGIVGPMKQEAPRIQIEPIRRNVFLKLIDSLRTPASLFGRSRAVR